VVINPIFTKITDIQLVYSLLVNKRKFLLLCFTCACFYSFIIMVRAVGKKKKILLNLIKS